jgi:hypothetical protein
MLSVAEWMEPLLRMEVSRLRNSSGVCFDTGRMSLLINSITYTQENRYYSKWIRNYYRYACIWSTNGQDVRCTFMSMASCSLSCSAVSCTPSGLWNIPENRKKWIIKSCNAQNWHVHIHHFDPFRTPRLHSHRVVGRQKILSIRYTTLGYAVINAQCKGVDQPKTSKIVILHYQIDENFFSKVHFYDILNTNSTENFRVLCAQWSSSPPPTLQLVSTPMQCTCIYTYTSLKRKSSSTAASSLQNSNSSPPEKISPSSNN